MDTYKILIEWDSDELYARTGMRQDSAMVNIMVDSNAEAFATAKDYHSQMADCFKKSVRRIDVVRIGDGTQYC